MISNLITRASRAARVVHGRSGQSLVEYALVLSFVSLLSVVFMSIFEAQVRGLFNSIIVVLNAVRALI
jgi:Flp pilus assembly pilin Flp